MWTSKRVVNCRQTYPRVENVNHLIRLLAASDVECWVYELSPLIDICSIAVRLTITDVMAASLVARHNQGSWRYDRTTEHLDALLDALDHMREVVS